MASILGLLSGWKTYLAGAGLFGLALYDASIADWHGASVAFFGALAAIGLRAATAAQTQELVKVTDDQTKQIASITNRQTDEIKRAVRP